jgi:hypothetical protein
VEGVNRLLLIIALIGIAFRGLIPMGWMPTGERGFEIIICTGVDTQKVWLDAKGNLHKQDPSKKDGPKSQPCAFGASSTVANLPLIAEPDFIQSAPLTSPIQPNHLVSVGKGLAAPPPPATGPPILI